MAAPEIAKQHSQQIVETEHLLKALLEQPNGMAQRVVTKADANPTALLDATEAFIQKQPRVTGDSSQAPRARPLPPPPSPLRPCCTSLNAVLSLPDIYACSSDPIPNLSCSLPAASSASLFRCPGSLDHLSKPVLG